MARHAIFISYRRDDSADVAGRIYDRLRDAVGVHNVFKDVDAMPVGTDFGAHIVATLEKCRIVLALIGPSWLDARDEGGDRRLDDPRDWVRAELEAAIANPGLVVIPLLVNGATMPPAESLPEKLSSLSSLNAAIVRRDPDFHKDTDRLLVAIRTKDWRYRIGARSPIGKVIAFASLVVLTGLLGVSLVAISTSIAESNRREEDRNRLQQTLHDLGLDPASADDNSARIQLYDSLGPAGGPSAETSYAGPFEAVGLSPYWAVRVNERRLSLQMDYGTNLVSNSANRAVYEGGMQLSWEQDGVSNSMIVKRASCSLLNGVRTDYQSFLILGETVYTGCASRGASTDWPLTEAGSDAWELPPTGEHD